MNSIKKLEKLSLPELRVVRDEVNNCSIPAELFVKSFTINGNIYNSIEEYILYLESNLFDRPQEDIIGKIFKNKSGKVFIKVIKLSEDGKNFLCERLDRNSPPKDMIKEVEYPVNDILKEETIIFTINNQLYFKHKKFNWTYNWKKENDYGYKDGVYFTIFKQTSDGEFNKYKNIIEDELRFIGYIK